MKLQIPLMKDSKLRTALDIALNDKSLNVTFADAVLRGIKDYPMGHVDACITKILCKAVEKDVPALVDFFNSRLVV